MEEEIEVVAFACRGTLLDWTGAIEAVAYELARCNGESPLDRGAALRRRVETLADGHGLARGFERLARERGYRGEESGEESLARVVALARPAARRARSRRACGPVRETGGRRLPRPRTPARCTCSAAPSRPSSADPRELGEPPDAILYVTAAAGGAPRRGAAACAPPRPATSRRARPGAALRGSRVPRLPTILAA